MNNQGYSKNFCIILMFSFIKEINTTKKGTRMNVTNKHIGIITIGHNTLQFSITNKVDQHVTATQAIIIEEDYLLSLVDQYPETPHRSIALRLPPLGWG